MNENNTSNDQNITDDYNSNSSLDYQDNQNDGCNNQPSNKGNMAGSFFGKFIFRILLIALVAGLIYGGNVILNKTSLFTQTYEVEGVSIDLPRGYGYLDDNTIQSGKDDSDLSNDNVTIDIIENEIGLSAMEIVYNYILLVSDDNLEIIDYDEIDIEGKTGYYMEYGTNAVWYYDDGTSEEAYCSGIAIAVNNGDCMVVVDLYSRRGEDNRNLLSDKELQSFMKYVDTITFSDSVKDDITTTTVTFGSKSLSLPVSYSTYEPDSETTDYGTNFYFFADDGDKYIDFADYSLEPLTEEEKQSYIDSFSEILVDTVEDNGTYHIIKYFGSNDDDNYAGIAFLYDEFVLDYYWLCIDEPTQENFDNAIAIMETLK